MGALVATTATAMAWEDTMGTLAMPDTPVWDMPDMVATPDTVLELMDIMLDTMASTETELRVLPVSTPLTFPFPVPVRSVILWWTLGRILRWTLRIRRNSPIPLRNLPQQPRRSSPLLILFLKNHSK